MACTNAPALVAMAQDLSDVVGGFGTQHQLGLTAIFAHPVRVEGFEVRRARLLTRQDAPGVRENGLEACDVCRFHLIFWSGSRTAQPGKIPRRNAGVASGAGSVPRLLPSRTGVQAFVAFSVLCFSKAFSNLSA
jgi:hypothetical protein